MSPHVLTLNAGSSSLKFALFRAEGLVCRAIGQVDGLTVGGTTGDAALAVRTFGAAGEEGRLSHPLPSGADHRTAMQAILGWIGASTDDASVSAIGHRVVHGGMYFDGPIVLTEEAMRRIEALSPLAPLHQPHNIAGIRAAATTFAGVPQIACFDTAFHRGHPAEEDAYAIPRALHAEGIRRYGFHGLSYEYVAGRLREIAPERAMGRVVICHLGNGASICGLLDGRSVTSTMGFSPLDGLPMGTRCGQIDPAVVLHLMTAKGMTATEVSDLLHRRSGLMGLSGISADMRELEASDAPEARDAIAYFCARIRREIGGIAAVLGGVDLIAFTGGIGENSSRVRADALSRMGWLGVALDIDANDRHAGVISTSGSAIAVHVVRTNEELMIARHAARLATAA
jgi:acetate kinase